jgi:hypothetical protein
MVSHIIITYTDDNLSPLEIVTDTITQKVVSGLTDTSPIAMVTANITAIATPTGTTTTQKSEAISTSKRGRKPTGSAKSVIYGRTSLMAGTVDECN